MKRLKVRHIFIAFLAALIFGIAAFSGCIDLSNSIMAVRSRADKLRKEMSERIIAGFKESDVSAVKEQFCTKSQEIPDISEQIAYSFTFMDGNIESYKISDSIGYEGYGSEYGKVDDYEFGSDIFITTDTGKQYDIYLKIKYITDESIKGLSFYTISEPGYNNYCHAGFNWDSPYDAECGKTSAELIKSIADGDAETIKSLMCPAVSERAETDGQIQAVIEAFEGKPLFTERDDGLYDFSYNENDFSSHTNCKTITDGDGTPVEIWAKVYARPICTDAGEKYELEFVVFLQNDADPQLKGISFISLSDYYATSNNTNVSVGEWISFSD
ncbi:MAG: DUF5104 domain-containing protein [Clostridia bacterium]|nr:DUF5104 domain-containing protein [Clostridia bacterium]